MKLRGYCLQQEKKFPNFLPGSVPRGIAREAIGCWKGPKPTPEQCRGISVISSILPRRRKPNRRLLHGSLLLIAIDTLARVLSLVVKTTFRFVTC